MKNVLQTSGKARLTVVALFGCLSFGLFIWMFTGTGNTIPFVQPREWRAVVYVDDADNLVQAGRVQIAGVQVGKVIEAVREGEKAKITFDVNKDVAPLHEGVHIRIGNRSLIEDSYLDVTDGKGAGLPDGVVIPESAVQPSVQVRDVLASLDTKTRSDAGALLRSMGPATQGTQPEVARVVKGLGDLGAQGNTALDAIAAQSKDLQALSQQLPVVLDSLDTGKGQIANVVTDAQRLTRAVSRRQDELAATVQKLPGTLDSAKEATSGIHEISEALAPVAKDLKEAAPDLSKALQELPPTTKDLRGLLPSLHKVLDKAPATLDRVSPLSENVQSIVPPARELSVDLNPALRYAAPYGDEVGRFLDNFAGVLNYTDEKGVNYIRLQPTVNTTDSIQSPVLLPRVGTYTNPFPDSNRFRDPGPFGNKPYPHVNPDQN